MAKDIYHTIVREALVKDGWTITHDPYLITQTKRRPYEVDLGAEKIIAAERGTEHIAVEVKSFLNPSPINDFHTALGQYETYLDVLEMKQIDRIMYLAMPHDTHTLLSTKEYFRYIINKRKVKFILFDPETITIKEWIE